MRKYQHLFSILIIISFVGCGIVEPEHMNGSLNEEHALLQPTESTGAADRMAKQIDNPEQYDEHPVLALPIKPNITK